MVASAALYNVDFVNLGPLTTTYTAPAACATNNNRIGFARPTSLGFPTLFENCDLPTYGDCIPDGAKLDDDFAKRSNERGRGNAIYYHQPASACPESWTTAGIAAKGSDGQLSTSGIFVPPADVTTAPRSNPTPNIFMEALSPGETAIVCCPSGFTANEGVGCHSTMPLEAYTADTVCSRSTNLGVGYATVTFDYAGEAVTGVAVTEVGPKLSVTSVTTAAPRKTTAYVVASYIPAVTLVHGGGEGGGDEAKPTSTKKQDEAKPTSTKKEEETKPTSTKDEDSKPTSSKKDEETKSTSTKKDEDAKPTSTKKEDSKPTNTPVSATSFATSKISATPSGEPQPTSGGDSPEVGNSPGSGDSSSPGAGSGSDGNSSGNGSGGDAGAGKSEGADGNGEGTSNGKGGSGDVPPEAAGNMRWGNLSKTVTAVWGLAAISGMLVAAL